MSTVDDESLSDQELELLERFQSLLRSSQEIFTKGRIQGKEVRFSDEDARNLLSNTSEMELILPKLKQMAEKLRMEPMNLEPLEVALETLKKRMYPVIENL